MTIAEIEHTGYRGPLTNNLFLPAGKWTVGTKLDIALRIVPDNLARYLVDTGQAKVTLEKPEIKHVTVVCDRCGREVVGMEGAGFTAGFYRVGEEIWHKYADEGEKILCDSCMQNDPRYLVDYPPSEGESDKLVIKDAARAAALDDMTVDELRVLAEEIGIEFPASYMKKADLIALIISQPDQSDSE